MLREGREYESLNLSAHRQTSWLSVTRNAGCAAWVRGRARRHGDTRRSINIYVARAPNIRLKILEQECNSLIESHMMTGVKIWG